MDENKLQMLLDRMVITDVSTRYAAGVDMRDKELYRSCFVDEIKIDFSSMGMGEAMMMNADVWVDQAFTMISNYQSTQHIITNHDININGDEAASIAYVQAQHFNADNYFTLGGYYTNKLVRTPDGWRISELKLTSMWQING